MRIHTCVTRKFTTMQSFKQIWGHCSKFFLVQTPNDCTNCQKKILISVLILLFNQNCHTCVFSLQAVTNAVILMNRLHTGEWKTPVRPRASPPSPPPAELPAEQTTEDDQNQRAKESVLAEWCPWRGSSQTPLNKRARERIGMESWLDDLCKTVGVFLRGEWWRIFLSRTAGRNIARWQSVVLILTAWPSNFLRLDHRVLHRETLVCSYYYKWNSFWVVKEFFCNLSNISDPQKM